MVRRIITNPDCEVCDELHLGQRPKAAALLGDGNRLVAAGGEWAAMPSLGPVSSRHVLLLPTSHRRFSAHTRSSAQNMMEAFDVWDAFVEDKFSIAFEHANAAEGCGVTHAHVHFAVLNKAVDARALFADVELEPLASLSLIAGDRRELFWCRDSRGALWLSRSAPFKSQFARVAVGALNGAAFETDWKRYTHAAWFSSSAAATRRFARRLQALAEPMSCLIA